jgi:hypothetical protein
MSLRETVREIVRELIGDRDAARPLAPPPAAPPVGVEERRILATELAAANDVALARRRDLDAQEAALDGKLTEQRAILAALEAERQELGRIGWLASLEADRVRNRLERALRDSAPACLGGFIAELRQLEADAMRHPISFGGVRLPGGGSRPTSNGASITVRLVAIREAIKTVEALLLEPLTEAELRGRLATMRAGLPEIDGVEIELLTPAEAMGLR